ncbi:hypothetical protein, partial [Enterococcus faecalis]|uniref:hypothetical protein n=1 Tax=Enterococcus faecalis TaxID=1351 RepID=UPI003D6A866F
SIAAAAQSSVSVVARGTIHSGAISNGNGTTPAGILAGYFPGGIGSPNAGVHGDVVVTNYADITADAGDGIRAYDYGDGNVTVNENAGTITALGAT